MVKSGCLCYPSTLGKVEPLPVAPYAATGSSCGTASTKSIAAVGNGDLNGNYCTAGCCDLTPAPPGYDQPPKAAEPVTSPLTPKSALKSLSDAGVLRSGGRGTIFVTVTSTATSTATSGTATSTSTYGTSISTADPGAGPQALSRSSCSANGGVRGGGGGGASGGSSGGHSSFRRPLAAVVEEPVQQRPPRPVSVSCPGTALSAPHPQNPPHPPHRLAIASRADTTVSNGTNGTRRLTSNEASSKRTLSGVSAGSRYCFSDNGNSNNGLGATDKSEFAYDDLEESDPLTAPRESEPGECAFDGRLDPYGEPYYDDEEGYAEQSGLSGATAASSAAYVANAAARLRSAAAAGGGGSSSRASGRGSGSGGGGGGGDPSRSVKSNGSSWSFKVMADLQLTPDRHGRLRLPSILMFTHRRPPRHARTEAWWTKIRGVLIETGRSMTASIAGYRDRRRQKNPSTNDGGGGSGGGGAGAVDEEEYDGRPSLDDRTSAPSTSRSPSRGRDDGGSVGGSDGGGGGGGGGSNGSRREPSREPSRWRLAASRSVRSEGGTAVAAAAAASVRPDQGPGLPGAVSSGASALDLGPRPRRIAAASDGGRSAPMREASSCGGGYDDALPSGAPFAPHPGGSSRKHISGIAGDRCSGGSSRVSRSTSSRASSYCSSQQSAAFREGRYGGGSDGNTGGGGEGAVMEAGSGYSSLMAAFERQLPPLGLAFTTTDDDEYGECPPQELTSPSQTRTPTEEVRNGGGSIVGDTLPGEQVVAPSATPTAAGCLAPLSASCDDCTVDEAASAAAAGLGNAVDGLGCKAGWRPSLLPPLSLPPAPAMAGGTAAWSRSAAAAGEQGRV